MPVTARLSRLFYERFGDEIVNELVEWLNAVDMTYRSDLERINDMNFARFEAKLDQRLAELRAELRAELTTKAEIKGVRDEILANLNANFASKAELAALRADIIKWMFVFWAGTALAGVLLR